MSRQRFLILTILVLAFLISVNKDVVLAHTPSPSPCNDPVCNIDILDFEFNLAAMTIRPPNPTTGQSVMVVWFNHGSYLHSVISGTPAGTPDGIIDQDVQPQTSFSFNITEAVYNQILSKYSNGVLPYYCKYHYTLGMTATLTVSGSPIPEFSLPTFWLTMLMISTALVATILRSRKH